MRHLLSSNWLCIKKHQLNTGKGLHALLTRASPYSQTHVLSHGSFPCRPHSWGGPSVSMLRIAVTTMREGRTAACRPQRWRPGQGGSSWGGPDLRRSRTAAASGVRSLTPHHRLSADAAPRLLCGHSWLLTPSGDCSSPVLVPSLTVPGKAPYGLCLGEALNPGAATVPRRWDGMIRHLWTPHGETAEKLISLKKGSCKP